MPVRKGNRSSADCFTFDDASSEPALSRDRLGLLCGPADVDTPTALIKFSNCHEKVFDEKTHQAGGIAMLRLGHASADRVLARSRWGDILVIVSSFTLQL